MTGQDKPTPRHELRTGLVAGRLMVDAGDLLDLLRWFEDPLNEHHWRVREAAGDAAEVLLTIWLGLTDPRRAAPDDKQ